MPDQMGGMKPRTGRGHLPLPLTVCPSDSGSVLWMLLQQNSTSLEELRAGADENANFLTQACLTVVSLSPLGWIVFSCTPPVPRVPQLPPHLVWYHEPRLPFAQVTFPSRANHIVLSFSGLLACSHAAFLSMVVLLFDDPNYFIKWMASEIHLIWFDCWLEEKIYSFC